MERARVSVLIFFLALFGAGCSRTDNTRPASNTQASEQAAGATFKTPEEAINHYLDGVVRNDARKILEASAINEMAGKFRFDLHVERLGAISPDFLAPADSPLYSEINKAQLSSQILSQVKYFSYSLLSGEKMDGTVFQADAERANRFIKDVDPKRLSTLAVKKISPPNQTVMNDARYLENSAKNARSFGADESTERLALLSFEQNYYYLGFTLLRYGSSWKIANQASPLANTNPRGVAEKTTEEKFQSMIDGR